MVYSANHLVHAVAQHVALKATNLKMHGLVMGRMKALYLLYYAPSFCLFSHLYWSHVYLHFIFWFAVGWISEVGGCSWDYGRYGEQNNYVSEARPVCSDYLYRELKHQALPILMPTSKLFLVSFPGSSLRTNFVLEYRKERGNEAVFFLFSFSLPFLLSSFTSPSTQISLSI